MKPFFLSLLVIFLTLPAPLLAQNERSSVDRLKNRISDLEREQSNLEMEISSETRTLDRRMDKLEDNATAGFGLFLSGIICALWAQFTRRSGWLWFFFGLLLAPIALIAMVWKNASGLASGRLKFWTHE